MSSENVSIANKTFLRRENPTSAISSASNDTRNVKPTTIASTFIQLVPIGATLISPTTTQKSLPTTAPQTLSSSVGTTLNDDQTAATTKTAGSPGDDPTQTETVLPSTGTSKDINAASTSGVAAGVQAGGAVDKGTTTSQEDFAAATASNLPESTTAGPSTPTNPGVSSSSSASGTAPVNPNDQQPEVLGETPTLVASSQSATISSSSDAVPTSSNAQDSSSLTTTPSFTPTTSQETFSSSGTLSTESLTQPPSAQTTFLSTIATSLEASPLSTFHTSAIPATTNPGPSVTATAFLASGKVDHLPAIIVAGVSGFVLLAVVGAGVYSCWRIKARKKRMSTEFNKSLGYSNLRPSGNFF